MRNEPNRPLCFKRSGHCTRCGEPFPAGAVLHMVREPRVVWRVLIQNELGLTQPETVPVCRYCLESNEPGPDVRETPCVGCGATLRHSPAWPVRACSARCAQRARRAAKRAAKRLDLAPRTCAVCGGPFYPARADAVSCSDACRQRAYRERARGHQARADQADSP
jgi:hypothetical protein